MSLDYLLAIWFWKPIVIGFLFGLIYFFIVRPREVNVTRNYLKAMAINSIVLIVLLSVSIFVLFDYLENVAQLSRMSTNPVFALICGFTCTLTSLVFFGFINLIDYSKNLESRFPRIMPIAFLLDLHLYLLVFNAWLMTLYFNANSPSLILVILGFIMALIMSNIKNHIQQLRISQAPN